jgi:ketosteroid isomerase-like protein
MGVWYEDYLKAWNDHDADAIAAWVTEDVEFEDVGLGHRLHGRAAVHASALEMFPQMGDMRIDFVGGSEFGDSYYYEWIMQPMAARGVSVGQRRDGLVTHNRDYWCMPPQH